MTCSTCQLGRFEGFQIRCELTGELVAPLSPECDEYEDLDAKTEED